MDTVNLAAEQPAGLTVETRRWCVARTKPQAERWAHLNLLRIGFDAYLPLCIVRRRDRVLHSLIHSAELPGSCCTNR